MIYFLDASALVKRYVREPGSDLVRGLVRRKRRMAASGVSSVEVRGPVLSLAALLCERHPLRAYDAIQLASALRLGSEGGIAITFVCADDALHAAARAEDIRGMRVG